jgi:hypothetical protein
LHSVRATWKRQEPAPSHVPSSPQVVGSDAAQVLASRGGVPAAANVQLPIAVGAAHVRHVSVQAVLQQTPSTQKPLPHSTPQVHACPFSFCAFASPLQVPPSEATSPFASRASTTSTPPSVTTGFCAPFLSLQPATIANAAITTTHAQRISPPARI